MQKHYNLSNGKLVQTQDDEPALVTVFIEPDEAEKRMLVDHFKIDEHTLVSALDPDELSRLEFEPEHAAVIFKRPERYTGQVEFLFEVASIGAFIFKDRLIIVISDDIPLFKQMRFLGNETPVEIVLKLVYLSIVHFREHLKVISTISDEIQNKINESMENKYLINLFTLQKSLVYYLNSISSNGALLEKVRHNVNKLGMAPQEVEVLDDILVENNQCYRQAEIYSSILASLMDARASIVSNNLNVIMKTLTLITVAIMVPTFVVSAFSMNVSMPFNHSNPIAFFAILGLALASALAFLAVWKRIS